MTSKITPANPQPIRRPVAYGMSGASQAVNVGITKLREEINAKRLRARKVGRRSIITANDLEDWAASLPDLAPDTVAKRVARTEVTET